uniref:Uncharacterized protein n=1 Tax=Sphaerodactylus townsendi TaxID=933632 RepID=A0ACB8EJC1_9SAUR
MEILQRKLTERNSAQLDNMGFSIVKKCIHAVETRGINEQGLYRIVGVNSRVQKLLCILMGNLLNSYLCGGVGRGPQQEDWGMNQESAMNMDTSLLKKF